MNKSPLETDIFNYHTPEFFINMKNIPDKTSKERKSFVLEEKRKCREGININGVNVVGGLYFHLNYYHLQKDIEGSLDKKEISLPTLRDNEWIVFNDYDSLQKDRKIYTLFGARQLAKSEIEVSLTLRELSVFKNTEALALFQADTDKDTFVKKMRTAIDYGQKFIIVPNIDKSWDKSEIRFGVTRQDNSVDLRGILYIYNTQEGKKMQVGSGKTVTFLLSDEVAKSPFRAVYDTLEPAILTDFGTFRCIPFFTFTGGETEKARDAENLVKYPTDKQFKSEYNGQIVGGRVLDGRYRKDCKVPVKISEYLGKTTGTWLDNYIIHVTDFDLANKKIDDEISDAAKSPDKNTLLLKKIFFPRSLDDIFLSQSNNNFPLEEAKRRKEQLKEIEWDFVDLHRDELNKVITKFSDKTPIDIYPVKKNGYRDAPVAICEYPQGDAPPFTYVIGIDTYSDDESTDIEPSLGAVYVYKRMYNPFGQFQNQIVAYWAGRKRTLKEFHELCLMLAEFYNAINSVLPENTIDKSLFQYFFLKRKGHFLADSFELAQEINPNSKTLRKKGLSAVYKNQKHYMELMVSDANDEEEFTMEDGTTTVKMGIYNINDPMLCEEIIKYKGSPNKTRQVHDINCDRICAYGHCLTLAKYYDVKYPIAGRWKPKDEKDEEVKKPPVIKTPWGNLNTQHNPFSSSPKKKTSSKQFI